MKWNGNVMWTEVYVYVGARARVRMFIASGHFLTVPQRWALIIFPLSLFNLHIDADTLLGWDAGGIESIMRNSNP